MAEPAKAPPSLGLTGTAPSLGSGLSFGALPAFPSAAPKGDVPSASSFFGVSSGTAPMAPLPSILFPSDDKPMGALFSGISLPKDPLKPGALFSNQENQVSPFGANQTSSIPASSLFGTPLSTPAKLDSATSKTAAASTASRAASSLRTSAMSFPPTVASDPSLFGALSSQLARPDFPQRLSPLPPRR